MGRIISMLYSRRARLFSTASEAFPSGPQTIVVQKMGFRSGLTGFLIGASLTGFAALSYLIDDYRGSSHTLLVGMEELGEKVKKMHRHTAKIDDLDAKLAKIPQDYTSKVEAAAMQKNLIKAIDEIQLENLELKLKIWELENGSSRSDK